jgi:ABC-type sugar transport system substrate-binding protein
MRRRALAVAMAIALAAAVAACGSDNDSGSGDTGGASTTAAKSAGEPVKVGLIMKFPVDFYLAMRSAAEKWAESTPGVKLSVGIGHSATDDQGEINLIQSMVTQGVKVVLIDNDLPDWSKKSSVVATDNLKGGQLAGQFLAKELKKGATIAVLQGVPGVPALDDRVKGMEEGLSAAGIKIVGKAPTDCDQNKGVTAASDLLSAHPKVDAIYGACGPPILGAIQAVKKANRSADIVLVGFDALPDEVKQIQAGQQTASVAQFPAKMGEMGMATLLKAVKGESVPPNVDTGTAIVTKDNASQFG